MADEDAERPVVILAPSGRDAAVAASILKEIGIPSGICSDLESLVECLDKAGGAVIAEEALLSADRRSLAEWIAGQPPWSDFPFVLLIYRGGLAESGPGDPRFTELLGNVTVLERPF